MPSNAAKHIRSLYAEQSLAVRLYVGLRLSLGLLPAESINAHLPADGIIADVGCGYGVLANTLALVDARREVIGIDAHRARIDVARSTVGKRKNIRFVC